MANFVAVVGTLLIVLLMVFARPLASIVAPGFTDPVEVDTLVRLIRIVLPAQFFLIVGGLLSAVLQAHDRHFLPAMAPLVYSAAIIVGGLLGTYHSAMGAEGFAWGVLVGSMLGTLRAAALRLPQDAPAVVADAVLSQCRPQALSLAVVSDHDRVLDRGRRRVDHQEPSVVSRRRRRSPICNTAER